MSNKNNANKDAKTMSELGKNLVISSKNVKKTILPRAVGEELDFYQRNAYSFDEYYQEICNWEAIISTAYCNHEIKSDREAHIVNLLNAWINGWEEE